MNMVSVLAVPLMIMYDQQVVETVNSAAKANGFTLARQLHFIPVDATRVVVLAVSILLIAWAIWQSKRELPAMAVLPEQSSAPEAEATVSS